MAGTKEKPCHKCLYDSFDEYKKAEVDACWMCTKASNWKPKIGDNSHGGVSAPKD